MHCLTRGTLLTENISIPVAEISMMTIRFTGAGKLESKHCSEEFVSIQTCTRDIKCMSQQSKAGTLQYKHERMKKVSL